MGSWALALSFAATGFAPSAVEVSPLGAEPPAAPVAPDSVGPAPQAPGGPAPGAQPPRTPTPEQPSGLQPPGGQATPVEQPEAAAPSQPPAPNAEANAVVPTPPVLPPLPGQAVLPDVAADAGGRQAESESPQTESDGAIHDPWVRPATMRDAPAATTALRDPFADPGGTPRDASLPRLAFAQLDLRDPFVGPRTPLPQRPRAQPAVRRDLQNPFTGGPVRWEPCAPRRTADNVEVQRPAAAVARPCRIPGPLRDPFGIRRGAGLEGQGPQREPALAAGSERAV